MTLLEGPSSKLAGLMVVTVIATASLAAYEVYQFGGMSAAPHIWFLFILLFWIVFYPAYLHRRRLFGLRNLAVAAIIVALIFSGISLWLWAAIQDKKSEIRQLIKTESATTATMQMCEYLVIAVVDGKGQYVTLKDPGYHS